MAPDVWVPPMTSSWLNCFLFLMVTFYLELCPSQRCLLSLNPSLTPLPYKWASFQREGQEAILPQTTRSPPRTDWPQSWRLWNELWMKTTTDTTVSNPVFWARPLSLFAFSLQERTGSEVLACCVLLCLAKQQACPFSSSKNSVSET